MASIHRFFLTYIRILKLAYRIHPGLLILLTVSNAAWGLTNLPVLYINKALIDIVISSIGKTDWTSAANPLILLIAARTIIEAFRSTLSRIQSHVSNSYGSLMSDRITIILGEKLNSLDVPTVESSDFQDKYSKVERQSHQRIWGMLSTLSEFPNAVTTLISGIIPILQFNPFISLAVLVVSFPEAIVNAKLAKLDYQAHEERNRLYRSLGWMNWIIIDTRQFYENKLLGNIRYISSKMQSLQNQIFQNEVLRRSRRVKWRTISDIPTWFLSAGLNIYFFALAIIGRISLGTAQLLYQSSQTFSSGVGMLMNNVAVIYEHYLFVNDYTWFVDLQPQIPPGKKPFPSKISRGIVFDHVWFKYPNSQDWALKDVSLTIGQNENMALVGENGAGKTTLLKLLLGFYRPQRGKITIDGTDILDFQPADYWKHIAALPQEYHLFPFSARESIAFSDLSRIEDTISIQEAAKRADIDSFISNLPKGYDTPLAKDLDGVEPSGGQKQRIAIARALFKKSQIMVLDEPTSNVDPKAEEEIFKNIIEHTKNQILILVSHRFSTVRRADKIIVIDLGRLTEEGTHDQLIKKKGLYAKLFTLQAKSYR